MGSSQGSVREGSKEIGHLGQRGLGDPLILESILVEIEASLGIQGIIYEFSAS